MTKIYTLENPETGEIRYVGKTVRPLKYRLSQHISSTHRCHKNSWIDSLDEDPVIKLVEEVNDDEWEFWERYWIAQFRAWGFDLVNHTDGGKGSLGIKQTKESNRKRSKSLRGRKRPKSVREKISQSKKGEKKSEKTKRKISESLRGKTQSIKTKSKRWKPIAKISNNKVVGIFQCLMRASENLDVSKGAISNAATGRRNTSAGFKWSYVKDIVYSDKKLSVSIEDG